MAAAFFLFALRSRAREGSAWPWLLGAGIAFALVAIARPAALAPLNRMWMALGKLLNRIVSPIVLAILFFGVVWPLGFVMRRAGGLAFRLTRAAPGESYWVVREPLANDHFTRQF